MPPFGFLRGRDCVHALVIHSYVLREQKAKKSSVRTVLPLENFVKKP